MLVKIHWLLLLFTTPNALGVMSYTLDENLNLNPKLNFQYRVLRTVTTEHPRARVFTLLDDQEAADKHIGRHSNWPSIIDIVLADTKQKKPEKHVFDKPKADANHPKTHIETGAKKYYVHMKPTVAKLSIEESSVRRPRKNKHLAEYEADGNGVRLVHDTDSEAGKSLSISSEENKAFEPKKVKKTRHKAKGESTGPVVNGTDKGNVAKEGIHELYVKTRKVKDDPKIKEFTKHVYEQSIKVFQSLKRKMTDYTMKKQVDNLMRNYDEKFGDFVRETQDQKIKTRLGGKKVILNTVDTSNRILERLVNHLINEMDHIGVLRNGPVKNVILNELNKTIDLENVHICSTMQICRSKDSFSMFISDLLSTILHSDDEKVIQFRDALTEVMKNIDVSRIFDAKTEQRHQQSIAILEAYDVDTVRPLLFVLKNLVTSKNKPIKVIGAVDSRVNKTMAYLEVLDTWASKIPPSEENVLVWSDIRNSLKEWSDGKRKNIGDLVQGFVDHAMKVVPKFSNEEAVTMAKHFATMLGP